MAIAEIPNAAAAGQDQRFLLPHPVSWQLYEQLSAECGDGPIRLTYDRGSLELMSPSSSHEILSRSILLLISALAEELDLPFQTVGASRWKRADLACGLEADECFYFRNEPAIRGKSKIDLSVCPPPDLAVEIEISRSAIDRLGIYAALGVPEVWRCDEQSVRVFVLTADGTYKEQESSLNLPALPLNVLSQFLSQRHTLDTTRLVKNFRRWVRENIVG